jgi:hypothetical protein
MSDSLISAIICSGPWLMYIYLILCRLQRRDDQINQLKFHLSTKNSIIADEKKRFDHFIGIRDTHIISLVNEIEKYKNQMNGMVISQKQYENEMEARIETWQSVCREHNQHNKLLEDKNRQLEKDCADLLAQISEMGKAYEIQFDSQKKVLCETIVEREALRDKLYALQTAMKGFMNEHFSS